MREKEREKEEGKGGGRGRKSCSLTSVDPLGVAKVSTCTCFTSFPSVPLSAPNTHYTPPTIPFLTAGCKLCVRSHSRARARTRGRERCTWKKGEKGNVFMWSKSQLAVLNMYRRDSFSVAMLL